MQNCLQNVPRWHSIFQINAKYGTSIIFTPWKSYICNVSKSASRKFCAVAPSVGLSSRDQSKCRRILEHLPQTSYFFRSDLQFPSVYWLTFSGFLWSSIAGFVEPIFDDLWTPCFCESFALRCKICSFALRIAPRRSAYLFTEVLFSSDVSLKRF